MVAAVLLLQRLVARCHTRAVDSNDDVAALKHDLEELEHAAEARVELAAGRIAKFAAAVVVLAIVAWIIGRALGRRGE